MQYDCDKVHHGLESPEHNMGIMIQENKNENKDNSDKIYDFTFYLNIYLKIYNQLGMIIIITLFYL
jgi:hypothetical protein